MKKFIATLLATVMLCASMSGVCFAEDIVFSDVLLGSWYCEDVYTAVSMGLVGGKGGGRYAPEDNLTYAEAIKLAACMHKSCTQGTTEFERTPVWYTPYVTYAEETGIKLRNYDLNAKITRADFLDIFSRALPANMMNEINRIADGNIPDVPMTYENAAPIYKLYRVGIVAGSDDKHNCRPGTNIKRSEVATILVRMMDPSKRVKFELKLSDERARYNTGYGVYDEKLAEYYNAVIMDYNEFSKKHTNNSSINLEMVYQARNGGQIEYVVQDLDGNGIHELIILMGQNVIDIYTNKDGVLKKLFPNCTFGVNEYLNILADGKLLTNRSNGDFAAEFSLYRMNDDASGVTKIGSVYHDENGKDPSKSGYEYVSFDEYIRRLSTYEASSIVGNLSRRTVADSIESSKEVHYNQGVKYFDEKNYLAAVKEFELAADYMNAEQLVLECYFVYGNDLLKKGDIEQADKYLKMCGTYKDAVTIINDYYYNDAQAALKLYTANYGGTDITKLGEYYDTAMEKFSLCIGYKYTNVIRKQLERSYKARKTFDGKNGYDKASFARATVEFDGKYMNIEAPSFTFRDGTSKLHIRYNAESDTFSADWEGVNVAEPYNNELYSEAWSNIVDCFSDVGNASDLKRSYMSSYYGNWNSVSDTYFVYQRNEGNYKIRTTVEMLLYTYNISITVSKS